MNVSSLRHGAVNGVRARDVWSNPNTMKLVKEDEIHFTEEVITRPVEPRMIPGGDEVIFARSGKLEVWSLTTHEHLWTAPPPQRSYFCTSLDFEVVENGRAVMIACEYSSPDDMPESRYEWNFIQEIQVTKNAYDLVLSVSIGTREGKRMVNSYQNGFSLQPIYTIWKFGATSL